MPFTNGAADMAKKKSPVSPTQRSLKLCREHGWESTVTERWNPFAKIRQDLFGFIDVLCLSGDCIIGIQTTSGDHVAERIQKIRDEPRAAKWLESGGRLFVHGWRKLVKSGRWECREIEITQELLSSTTAEMPDE